MPPCQQDQDRSPGNGLFMKLNISDKPPASICGLRSFAFIPCPLRQPAENHWVNLSQTSLDRNAIQVSIQQKHGGGKMILSSQIAFLKLSIDVIVRYNRQEIRLREVPVLFILLPKSLREPDVLLTPSVHLSQRKASGLLEPALSRCCFFGETIETKNQRDKLTNCELKQKSNCKGGILPHRHQHTHKESPIMVESLNTS